MKKVFQFFALVVVITLTSCSSTAKPEKSLLVQKSTNGEFITIQKMNSVEKDTIPTDMISLQKAKVKYKFEKKFILNISELANQETSRYVLFGTLYEKNNYSITHKEIATIFLIFVYLAIALYIIITTLILD